MGRRSLAAQWRGSVSNDSNINLKRPRLKFVNGSRAECPQPIIKSADLACKILSDVPYQPPFSPSRGAEGRADAVMGNYVTAVFGLEGDLHRTFSVFGVRSTVADGTILPVWFI